MSDPTAEEIKAVGDAIARTDLHPTEFSDNVCMALVSYLQDDSDCPEDQIDDETGWNEWAIEREKELRDRIARAAIIALDNVRKP